MELCKRLCDKNEQQVNNILRNTSYINFTTYFHHIFLSHIFIIILRDTSYIKLHHIFSSHIFIIILRDTSYIKLHRISYAISYATSYQHILRNALRNILSTHLTQHLTQHIYQHNNMTDIINKLSIDI